MTAVVILLFVLPLLAFPGLLVTAAVATFLWKKLRQPGLAVLLAGLPGPITMLSAAVCFALYDTEVDGPPPGNVIFGALAISIVAALLTLTVSALAVEKARRSEADL